MKPSQEDEDLEVGGERPEWPPRIESLTSTWYRLDSPETPPGPPPSPNYTSYDSGDENVSTADSLPVDKFYEIR